MSAIESHDIAASESGEPSLGVVPVVADVADSIVEPATVGPSRKPKRTAKQRVSVVVLTALPPLGVFVLVILGWYAANWSQTPKLRFLMPTPDQVWNIAFDPNVSSQVITGLFRTMGVAVTGLIVASVIGIVWATGMSLWKWVYRSTYPYAVVLQTIPILALVGLIGIWFGQQFGARVVVCVMIALFPMVSNTLFGLQSADRSHHELFKLQRASKWTVLTKLMFPGALPAIFLGLRTSAGLSVVGAIVGDMFFQQGEPGLGALMQLYVHLLNMAQLFDALIVSSLLGVFMFLLFGGISKLAVGRWYEGGR